MKAELKRLLSQIEKLPAREQEVLRLRYAESMGYKDLAAAAGVAVDEATSLLLSAINTLRGHSSKAGNKSKYLAFVHGELNEADTEAMAELVEADPSAREEFESILAMSDALTDLYDALAEEKPKASEREKAKGSSKAKTKKGTLEVLRELAAKLPSVPGGEGGGGLKSRKMIAGAFFAIAAVIVIYIFVDMQSQNSGEEISDAAAIEAAKNAEADAAGAPGAESALPAPAPAVAADAATNTPPPPAPVTDEPSSTAAAQATAPAPEPSPAPVPPRTMMVDAGKTVISKNLNKKTALTFLKKKLDKAPSCIPAADKKSKLIKAVIGLKPDGTYTQVNVELPKANKALVTKCLRSKLGVTAKSLKSSNKTGGKITLIAKIQ